jgi:uncharacterized protein YndB with AHSA1/START domain
VAQPTPGATSEVEHVVVIDARPETVFEYFVDPGRMVAWMGTSATLDPRPGGICRVAINPDAVMVGEYVEVEPHSRLVLTWGWENRLLEVPPMSTVVEVSLSPHAEGTELRLVHRELPQGALEFHTIGWRHYLDRLADRAAGRDPGADRFAGNGEQ